MVILTREQVFDLLPMEACISAMHDVFVDLANGDASQELRSVIPLAQNHVFGLMPAYLKRQGVVGAKVLSVCPDNHNQGLPSHQGVVTLFDAGNGTPLCVVDAEAVTAIRTAAVSAVATASLARAEASVLGILGTGAQARSHLEAMMLTRPIRRVQVFGSNPKNRQAFVEEMALRYPVEILAVNSAMKAVQGADIVCTVTAATSPILEAEWLMPGVHVNAVGACRKTDRELDTATVVRSCFYVDRIESALHEAGDFIIAEREGAISATHILGELGDLLVGRVAGRKSSGDITVFESLGLAIEDLAAANFVYEAYLKSGQCRGDVR